MASKGEGFVVVDENGVVYGAGATPSDAAEEAITQGRLGDDEAADLRELAEDPRHNEHGLSVMKATQRLIDATERFSGAVEDTGIEIDGHGYLAVADLPVVEVGGLMVRAPKALHRRLDKADVLADDGGTIQASDAVGLFPGEPTYHEAQSIRTAIGRLGGIVEE